MKSHTWHGFARGERVSIEAILAACEKRIRGGHIKDVPAKRRCMAALSGWGHAVLIYSPQSPTWGTSPFNPNAWETKDGERIDYVQV